MVGIVNRLLVVQPARVAGVFCNNEIHHHVAIDQGNSWRCMQITLAAIQASIAS